MPDESLTVRRKIGLEWGYDGRKYAADALTRRQNLGFRHRQRKAESWNPGKLNGADGISDIEGKAAREAASELGSERVSMERAGALGRTPAFANHATACHASWKQEYGSELAIPSNCRGRSPLFYRTRVGRQTAGRGWRRHASSPLWPRRRPEARPPPQGMRRR